MDSVTVTTEAHAAGIRVTIRAGGVPVMGARDPRARVGGSTFEGGIDYDPSPTSIRKFAEQAAWALSLQADAIIPQLIHAIALTEKPA